MQPTLLPQSGLSYSMGQHLLLDNEAADRWLSEEREDGKGRGATAGTQSHNCPAPANALVDAQVCQVARQQFSHVCATAEDGAPKTAPAPAHLEAADVTKPPCSVQSICNGLCSI